jgi:hypothetical protein
LISSSFFQTIKFKFLQPRQKEEDENIFIEKKTRQLIRNFINKNKNSFKNSFKSLFRFHRFIRHLSFLFLKIETNFFETNFISVEVDDENILKIYSIIFGFTLLS